MIKRFINWIKQPAVKWFTIYLSPFIIGMIILGAILNHFVFTLICLLGLGVIMLLMGKWAAWCMNKIDFIEDKSKKSE